MAEKVKPIPRDFIGQLLSKLNNYFLHTTYTEILFLKGEIATHFDINECNITLKEKSSVKGDNEEIIYSIYCLKIFDCEFELRFNHKVIEGKEIEVPRVVKNNEKKWWQINAPDTKVVVEKKKTDPSDYWVLVSISEYVSVTA